jgi:hypothetical protein
MTAIYKIPLRARFAKYKQALRSGVPQKGAYRLRLVQPVTKRKAKLAYVEKIRQIKEQADKEKRRIELKNQQYRWIEERLRYEANLIQKQIIGMAPILIGQ